MTFTCTAEANPAVHAFLLYKNGAVIKNMGLSGTWIKTMENAGQFVFRCEANNSIQEIGKSNDTILTVNGELLQFCYILQLWIIFSAAVFDQFQADSPGVLIREGKNGCQDKIFPCWETNSFLWPAPAFPLCSNKNAQFEKKKYSDRRPIRFD